MLVNMFKNFPFLCVFVSYSYFLYLQCSHLFEVLLLSSLLSPVDIAHSHAQETPAEVGGGGVGLGG